MRIRTLKVANFRSFDQFELKPDGESVILIGENGVGKTTILDCIARALGSRALFLQRDFRDIEQPIEIQLVLTDLNDAQRGVFADWTEFTDPPTLTIGVRVVWDADTEDVDTTYGYPRHEWRKATREARDALRFHWIPELRNASRLLQLGLRRSVLGQLVDELDIEDAIEATAREVRAAAERLADTPDLRHLLEAATTCLGSLLPGVAAEAFSLASTASTDLEILGELELILTHQGPALPVSEQSSGIAHLAIFVLALQAMEGDSGAILLVDEPEQSLHPHCQRAVLRRLLELQNQTILATHSASVLDRADPRRVIRISRDAQLVVPRRPSTLTADQAHRLASFTNPISAEAFFARRVILVEGISDRYALTAITEKLDRDLDAEGISIVSLDGGNTLGWHFPDTAPQAAILSEWPV